MSFNFPGLGGGGFPAAGAGFGAPVAAAGGGFGGGFGIGGFGAASAPAAAFGVGGGGGFGALGGFGAAAAVDADTAHATLPADADSISSVGFSPDSKYASASSWDGKVYVYTVTRNNMGAPSQLSPALTSPVLDGPLLDHDWISAGHIVAAGCGPNAGKKVLKMWDLQTNQASAIGQVSL
jgi:hypothetical protein